MAARLLKRREEAGGGGPLDPDRVGAELFGQVDEGGGDAGDRVGFVGLDGDVTGGELVACRAMSTRAMSRPSWRTGMT
jgi:hypothetical protein